MIPKENNPNHFEEEINQNNFMNKLKTMRNLSSLIFLISKLPFAKNESDKIEQQTKVGQSLKNLIENMSPTYIKFGQLISHRPDILPKVICDQLLSLTDNTQPISIDNVKARIEQALGNNQDFEIVEIDPKALGSASIAQVHKVMVKLPSGEQRWEAWKIQKGEIRSVFAKDLKFLRRFTKILDWTKLLPPIDHLAEEYQGWIAEETDFPNEANNLKKARSQSSFVPLIATKLPNAIFAPECYGVYISSDQKNQLIRMELVQGRNLNSIQNDINIPNEERREIINQALRGFMAQFLIYGFTQADPHISNLMWQKEEKKLYFVDWGLARDFSPIQGLSLLRMFRGFILGNRNLCYDGLFALLNSTEEEKRKLVPDLDIALGQVIAKININDSLAYRELGSTFLTGILSAILKHKIKIDAKPSAIFKAMATTDAVYTTVCPDYSIKDMLEVVVDISQLFLQKLLLEEVKTLSYFLSKVDQKKTIQEFFKNKLGRSIYF
jgi:ubiquinone biosynthesis protein